MKSAVFPFLTRESQIRFRNAVTSLLPARNMQVRRVKFAARSRERRKRVNGPEWERFRLSSGKKKNGVAVSRNSLRSYASHDAGRLVCIDDGYGGGGQRKWSVARWSSSNDRRMLARSCVIPMEIDFPHGLRTAIFPSLVSRDYEIPSGQSLSVSM